MINLVSLRASGRVIYCVSVRWLAWLTPNHGLLKVPLAKAGAGGLGRCIGAPPESAAFLSGGNLG